MIIDIRYHIASLVAVFLALAIGILIGTSLLGNEAIVEQQKQLTDRMEADLSLLREENQEVQTMLINYEKTTGVYQQFAKDILPLLVNQRLSGKNIAIVDTGNYGFNEDLVAALEEAGSKVTSFTTILPAFELADQGKKQYIIDYFALEQSSVPEVVDFLVDEVVRSLMIGDNLAVLNFLEEQNMLKKGGEYGVPLDAVIVIGGSSDQEFASERITIIDRPLLDKLSATGLGVFGVEHRDVPFSYMSEYQKYKISTVDNVDTVIGQVALVWAIEGKAGDYGVKTTAKNLLPDYEVPARETERAGVQGGS